MTEQINPIKVAAVGILADGLPKGNSYGETLAAGAIAALEAAGWRLVHPDGVTEKMKVAHLAAWDEVDGETSSGCIRAALAAAPTYATPAAPQKE